MITEWRWLFNIYFRTLYSQIAGHDILKSRFGTLYSQFPWAGIRILYLRSKVNRRVDIYKAERDYSHTTPSFMRSMNNCSASRPSIESKTNEEEAEVQVEKITIKAKPLPNGCVKAKTGDSTNDAVYLNWYNEVYMPNTIVGGQEMLAAVM